MPKLQIKTAQILQGDFQSQSLNLLLVFQVNCPGCFIYALPLAEKLHQTRGADLNVLGLSTAFEDFDLNTADHTQRLLNSGEMVGATKLFFQHHGQQFYTNPIHFPVAFDQVGDGAALFDDNDIDHVCSLNPSFPAMDSETQTRVRTRGKQVLQNRGMVGYTFGANQLQGTPSWILFDGAFNILAQWFGHKSEAEVDAILLHALESVPTLPT
ncbi:MAG: hypothetical protein AAGA83_13280 [Cyanobacteria bacterium P01_F01_bin.116]